VLEIDRESKGMEVISPVRYGWTERFSKAIPVL